MQDAWTTFLVDVLPEYKEEFMNQIEECRRKPGFGSLDLRRPVQ